MFLCDMRHKCVTDNYRVQTFILSLKYYTTNIAVRLKGQSYQEAASEFYRNCASYHDHEQFFLFIN